MKVNSDGDFKVPGGLRMERKMEDARLGDGFIGILCRSGMCSTIVHGDGWFPRFVAFFLEWVVSHGLVVG